MTTRLPRKDVVVVGLAWAGSIIANELADDFAVMDRGEVVMSGTRETFDSEAVRKHMTV